MFRGPSTVAVVGAGSVGATIGYACMIRGVADELRLYDVNRAKVDAEVLDLNHGSQFVRAGDIAGSDDIEICRDADIIVITAGAKQRPGQTRMELAEANTELMRSLVPRLVDLAPQALLLVVTNPVDVMTQVALSLSGMPASRVVGSGTVLDSSRLRHLLARRLRVAVGNVHALIAGEHGDSEIALWNAARIGPVPALSWETPEHGRLDDAVRARILEQVKGAAYEVIRGKGATNYAIGLAVARILEAILHDENRVLPVSSLLHDWHGISDVCMSVPSIVNRNGVESTLPVELDGQELAGLVASADTIRSAVRSLGF